MKILALGHRTRRFVALLSPALTLWAVSSVVAAETTGPLADYVAKPDASYGWKVRRREIRERRICRADADFTNLARHRLEASAFHYQAKQAANLVARLLMISGGKWSDELAGRSKTRWMEFPSKLG